MQSPPRRRNRPSGRRRECAVNSPRPRAAANCAGAALPTPSIKISGGWRRPLAAGTQKETPAIGRCFFLEVTPGFEPGNQGFADPCLTTWLCHHWVPLYYMRTFRKSPHLFLESAMPTHLCGHRIWSGQRGSNSLPPPWQGGALPDELCPQVVPRAGIEPATRGFSVPCSTN